MKLFLITAAVLLSATGAFAIYHQFIMSGIEEYSYQVLDTLGKVEIREYEPAYFNTVELSDSVYKDNSSQGFRILAGYIFGGNESNQKIAMTSPVVMDMEEKITMKFMVPSNEHIDSLPKPNDSRIELEYVERKKVAAIRFSGWASDEKIKKYAEELFEILEKNNILHEETYSYYGYNPPYQVVGRKNEIVVNLK